MSFSDFFIRRPVFSIIANALLLLLGLYALTALPLREFPSFEIPVVSVVTALPGATPDQVETQVTAVIEQAVSAVDGIDVMTSSSRAGSSMVQIQFSGDVDAARAAAKVAQAVAGLPNLLPADATTPTVQQASIDSAPILYLAVAGENQSALAITDAVKRIVKPALSAVPGIAQSTILGERVYAVRIEMDPTAMAAHDVTAAEIIAAIQRENVDLPAGSLVTARNTVPIVARTAVDAPLEFEDIVIRWSAGFPLRIGDVARATVGPEEEVTGIIIDGQRAVAVGVVPQGAANPLDIAKAITDALPTIQKALPSGMTITKTYDSTVYISQSLAEVAETLTIAVVLVVLVVMLFMGSLRASLITLVTIPLSLIGTLAFMALLGYSINLFTLLAFVLAIGLVVDDAIVDVENVQRHIDKGLSPMDAAFVGSREIGFAIVATTITLACVFAPVGLLPGMMGSLFREFAFTLAIAILLSGYVSRTLSPMMCSRLLRAKGRNRLEAASDRAFARLTGGYRVALAFALRKRWIVGVGAVAFLVGGGALLQGLHGEMAPSEDEGYVLFQFEAPEDASYAYLERGAREVEAVFAKAEDRAGSMTIIGMPDSTKAMGFLLLKPWEERTRSAAEIGRTLDAPLSDIAAFRTVALDPNPLSGGSAKPVQFVLTSSQGSYAQLLDVAGAFLEKARAIPGLVAPTLDLRLDSPEIAVTIDRHAAAELGVPMSAVTAAISAAFGQHQVSTFGWQGSRYAVILEADEADRHDPALINRLTVRGGNGQLIPLSALVAMDNAATSANLSRFNQKRAVHLQATVGPGADTMGILDALAALADSTLPEGVGYDYDGPSRQLKQMSASTGLVFVFAIVLIYMVLAAQFESFRDPVIVLSVLPLAVVGALLSLRFGGGSVNLYSIIGLITLVGLIAKHGILITEFANQRRDDGLSILDAALDAAATRLRSILMTTAAMVMGALPLVFASGPGAGSRHQIGLVIVGGLVLGSVFSLFVVPVVYTLLTRKTRKALVEPPALADAVVKT